LSLNVGTPLSAERPAPVRITMRFLVMRLGLRVLSKTNDDGGRSSPEPFLNGRFAIRRFRYFFTVTLNEMSAFLFSVPLRVIVAPHL
jgi:hypothetical protein